MADAPGWLPPHAIQKALFTSKFCLADSMLIASILNR